MTEAQTLAHADPDLVEMLEDLLSTTSSGDCVRAAEIAGTLPDDLLGQVLQAGLGLVGIPEASGGPGGTEADAAAVLKAAGRYSCPVPLAEQALTGGWLLASAGLDPRVDAYVVAVDTDLTTDGDHVTGSVRRVPWLRQIRTVVALADGGSTVVVLDVDADLVEHGSSLAGEPRDSARLDSAPLLARAPAGPATAAELAARAAATRVLLMAGACEAIQGQAVRYAAEREQFGKPINTFQAVATHLAVIVEETALVLAAADMVCAALGSERLSAEVAAAKIVAGESASKVARAAHQVYGAMGVTAECDLQLSTRRIWTWRDEHGSEAQWARVLGSRVVEAGPDGAWDIVCEPIGGAV